MAFSRRFPRDVKGSPYPTWEEVYLSKEEEAKLEQEQRHANLALMRECLTDAEADPRRLQRRRRRGHRDRPLRETLLARGLLEGRGREGEVRQGLRAQALTADVVRAEMLTRIF